MPDGDTQEKTEEPTQKRREEAREEGQVANSQDLNSAFTLLFSFLVLFFMLSNMLKQFMNLMVQNFTLDINMDFTIANVHTLFIEIGIIALQMLAPLMAAVAIIGVLVGVFQVGFLITPKVIIPKLSKLNPIEGAKNIFSKKTIVELLKSIAKIAIIVYISYLTINDSFVELGLLMNMDLGSAIQMISTLAINLVIRITFVMILIGIIDLFYQKWQHEQDLKMSKQEVKEERKQREGDPQIKSQRKQKQKEMAMSRMMQEVPDASVVITNPTHFAIALKFEMESMEVPLVVAKGKDEVAQRIKEVARENEVAVVEDKPLARTLYKATDIGEEIPADLYQAVAEILAYVYQLEEGRK